MLTSSEFKCVYFSSLLRQKVPTVANRLERLLEQELIPVRWLHHTNDIWCRDYMPIWVNKEECVQFVFNPAYYNFKKYRSWRTEPYSVTAELPIKPYLCGVILDGGNVINTANSAIITERVFKDNPRWNECQLMEHIKGHLQVKKLVIVPDIPGDCTGHIDGMMRFLDDKTVVVNDLSLIMPSALYKHLRLCLYNADLDIVTIPNQLHLNLSADDNTGDYINYLEIGDLMIIPGYEKEIDKLVQNIYKELFPERRIIQVDIRELTPLGGGLNCISWCC